MPHIFSERQESGMEFEKQLRQALQTEVDNIRHTEDMKQNVLKNVPYEKGHQSMKKRVIAVMVAAAIMAPTAGFAGYSYLADHIFGSQEKFLSQGGTSEGYEHIEEKLKEAKKILNQQEYEQMESLLREVARYQKKMVGADGKPDMSRLSAAERERYAQLEKELEPYSEKVMQVQHRGVRILTLEESQKLLDFPVRTPIYVPQGYKLSNAVGVLSANAKHDKPTINMYYEKNGTGLGILQSGMRENDNVGLSNDYARTEEYTLQGYRALFGEKDGNKENTLIVMVPKQGNNSAYRIRVSGTLDRGELEKIALSMIQP
jgi:hypothetical protein